MSLRIQYSLRQALAVILFGLPLPILDQLLARTISPDLLEFIPSLSAWIAVPGLLLLGAVTFLRAYERFEDEFQPPFESTTFRVNWLGQLIIFTAIFAISFGPTGLPTNEFQWARSGIIAGGLYIGWQIAKWVFFDWIERARVNPTFPPDPPDAGVTANPLLPTGTLGSAAIPL